MKRLKEIFGRNEPEMLPVAYSPETSAKHSENEESKPALSNVFFDKIVERTNIPKRRLVSLARRGMTLHEFGNLLKKRKKRQHLRC